MRIAAFISATIIAVGLYLVTAATLGFDATWIGLGVLAISVASAVGLVATSGADGSGAPISRA